MNQFKYINKELWLDIPRPRAYEFRDVYPGGKEAWEAAVKEWKSRLHYSCSTELKAILKEGQLLRGDEFKLIRGKQILFTDQQQWQEMSITEKNEYFEMVAIPLPEQTISNYKPAIMNKYPDFFPILEENYQAQIAGFYNDDKTDEERKIRNAVIEEYQDLIAIYKSRLISEQPPTVKEEQVFTLKEILHYGAVCAVKGRDMNPVNYFKETFGIDITKIKDNEVDKSK